MHASILLALRRTSSWSTRLSSLYGVMQVHIMSGFRLGFMSKVHACIAVCVVVILTVMHSSSTYMFRPRMFLIMLNAAV
jgi:hypothetical protein